MKILLATDGSKFTKKALAFLATHENLSARTRWAAGTVTGFKYLLG